MLKRESKGNLTTEAIANQLRVSESYIVAIESGDYDALPGLTFAQGYIRAYARIVGLDALETENQLKTITQPRSEKSFQIRGMPKRHKKVSVSALFTTICTLIIIAIIGLAGTWFYHNHLIYKQAETINSAATTPLPAQPKEIHKGISAVPSPSGSKSLTTEGTHAPYPMSPVNSHQLPAS